MGAPLVYIAIWEADRSRKFPVVLLAALIPAAADAQQRSSCTGDTGGARPSAGIVLGRSSPYMDLHRDVSAHETNGSVQVRGGPEVGARADLPIFGRFCVRVDGSIAHWSVERRTYDPARNYQTASTMSAGHVSVRQVGVSAGFRAGFRPGCAYVLAGKALYAIGYADATARRPASSISAGVESALAIDSRPHGSLRR